MSNNIVKRYFKCFTVNSTGDIKSFGRYSGFKPMQAAGKAFTQLFKNNYGKDDENFDKNIKFGLYECTRNKIKKKYYYEGRRIKRTNVERVNIKKSNGQVITIEYKYNNILKKSVKNKD